MHQEIKILNERYYLKLQRENFTATMNQHRQVIIIACSFMVNIHNPSNKADLFDCKNTLS